jgi:hypothetical protein
MTTAQHKAAAQGSSTSHQSRSEMMPDGCGHADDLDG